MKSGIKGVPKNEPWLVMKLHLKAFWKRFGGTKNLGRRHERDKKLKALVEYAGIVIPFRTRQPNAVRREKFNAVKADRHSLRSHPMCFGCGAPATCRHHIIQIQNGGHDAKKNLVSLCDACHAEIHPWLKEQ